MKTQFPENIVKNVAGSGWAVGLPPKYVSVGPRRALRQVMVMQTAIIPPGFGCEVIDREPVRGC
jgi:hypothetical protein